MGVLKAGTLGNNYWQIEDHHSTAVDGKYSMQVKNDSIMVEEYYAVQLFQRPIPVEKDKVYTFTFWAKASAPRGMIVQTYWDSDPWIPTYGGPWGANLDTLWKKYSYYNEFVPCSTDSKVKLAFCVGADTATVWIDNVQIQEKQCIYKHKNIGGVRWLHLI